MPIAYDMEQLLHKLINTGNKGSSDYMYRNVTDKVSTFNSDNLLLYYLNETKNIFKKSNLECQQFENDCLNTLMPFSL